LLTRDEMMAVTAVIDEAQAIRGESGSLAALFAATYPNRCSSFGNHEEKRANAPQVFPRFGRRRGILSAI
jgi:hypothetical protein